MRERSAETRYQAQRADAVLPLIGREQEFAFLLECWSRTKSGNGQCVLLVGEAGMGKLRICQALIDAITQENHTFISYQCSPYYSDSALWPVIQQLLRAAEITPQQPHQEQLDRLESLLRKTGEEVNTAAPLMANLLSLNGESRYGQIDLTPQIRRARTLKSLTGQIIGLAAKKTVLIVLEDAHWADPTMLELTEQYLAGIAGAQVLLMITSRPDNQPKLSEHSHLTRITLNRLSSSNMKSIIAGLTSDKALADDIINAIIARADGVPLFMEELTKAVQESGATSDFGIPISLHDSLMARLDRISVGEEIAQTAACIGRSFDYKLLQEIAGKSEQTLLSGLRQLTTAELVFCHGTPSNASYNFKHALIQEAAYNSLLRTKRQELHARIAHEIENRSPTIAQVEPELIAHHLSKADDTERAIDYWLMAARRASDRSAYREVVAFFDQALLDLHKLPDNAEVKRRAVDVRLEIGVRRILIPASFNLGQAYFFHGKFRHAIETVSKYENDIRGALRHERLSTTGTSACNWLGNLAGAYALKKQSVICLAR